MIRIIFWFAILGAVTFGATWMADQPGTLNITWLGYNIEVHIGIAMLAIAMLFLAIWIIWGITKWIFGRPTALGGFFSRRRIRKGHDALSKGLIAIGAGDEHGARQYAKTAARILPNEPLAKLLEAQSAKAEGDTAKVKQVFKEMTKDPETKLLGLRGLFNEARAEKDIDSAKDIAREALRENSGAAWASGAMLVSYASEKDWPAVLTTVENQRKSGLIDAAREKTLKATVLTAQAIAAEDSDIDAAIDLATRANKLDPSLVPAAVIAGRALGVAGSMRKASRILEKTWKLNPHPEIAETYAHIRPGDSVDDRLQRMHNLVRVFHGGEEGGIAIASAAIDAKKWKEARESLKPYALEQPRARVCTMMAEIETGEFADKGRAREWMARAVRAKRDPAWTADGFVSSVWLPASPITGELGAFTWKVPVEGLGYTEQGTEEEIISDFAREPAPAPEPVEVKQIEVVPEVTQELPDTVETADVEPVKKDKPAAAAEKPDEKAKEVSAEEPKPSKPEPRTVQDKPSAPVETTTKNHQPDDPGPRKKNGVETKSNWFS